MKTFNIEANVKKASVRDSIECLLQYAVDTRLIAKTDRVQKRNEIAALLRVEFSTSNKSMQDGCLNQAPLNNSSAGSQNNFNIQDNCNTHYSNKLHKTHDVGNTGKRLTLTEILGNITDYAAKTGLIPRNTNTYRDLFDTKVMGLVTPRQSEVIRRFTDIKNKHSIEKATEYFYSMCQASNYIRTDRIRKNRSWSTPTEFGQLAITINLSKPEKDPRDIAEAASAKKSQYPKCVLCVENVCYAGRVDHPARQNLRVIPLILGNEPWYFQYSPYVYYDEHCIILSEEHRPLVVDSGALNRMLDFIDAFPHYFVGSNAGLPIVGGSILNHDHYQGGRETFPLDRAPIEHMIAHPGYPGITAGTVKWCMSTIRLVGQNRQDLLDLASLIMDTWHDYRDESANIIPYTKEPFDLNEVNGANETAQINKPNGTAISDMTHRAYECKIGMPHKAYKVDTGVANKAVKCESTCKSNIPAAKPHETANTLRSGMPRKIRHNAITPTVRKDAQGNYIINLTLRNNITTPDRPQGLFHPRPKLHHIKKENIGVIEVMGMAILPGRLNKELAEISKMLCGEVPVPAWMPEDAPQRKNTPQHYENALENEKQEDERSAYTYNNTANKDDKCKNRGGKAKNRNSKTQATQNHILYKHRHWINELMTRYGNQLSAGQARQILEREVGNKFLEVLLDASVFKQDAEGQAAFQRFIKSCGFAEI